MQHPVMRARLALEAVAPLTQDCGALCGGACCRDDEDEGLGMLLFPGEEALYNQQDEAWMRVEASNTYHLGRAVPFLVCEGTCPRDRRPLACRIFPLGPKVRKGGVSARADVRARHLCPLYEHGERGLSPAFVAAVGEAFSLLWEDPTQRDYLAWLSGQIDAHGKLLRGFFR